MMVMVILDRHLTLNQQKKRLAIATSISEKSEFFSANFSIFFFFCKQSVFDNSFIVVKTCLNFRKKAASSSFYCFFFHCLLTSAELKRNLTIPYVNRFISENKTEPIMLKLNSNSIFFHFFTFFLIFDWQEIFFFC